MNAPEIDDTRGIFKRLKICLKLILKISNLVVFTIDILMVLWYYSFIRLRSKYIVVIQLNKVERVIA